MQEVECIPVSFQDFWEGSGSQERSYKGVIAGINAGHKKGKSEENTEKSHIGSARVRLKSSKVAYRGWGKILRNSRGGGERLKKPKSLETGEFPVVQSKKVGVWESLNPPHVENIKSKGWGQLKVSGEV